MVELEPILAAEVSTPRAYVFRSPKSRPGQLLDAFRPGAETMRSPMLAFVVRHPDAGVILVDTGLHPDALRDLRSDYGRLMGYVFKSLEPAEGAFDAQLRSRGIEPGDVERVVMTHLHVDHTGAMRLLPNAEFVSTTAEWAAATARGSVRNGYVTSHLPPESRMRLLDIDSEGRPDGPFSRTIDLLGDGSIRLLSTPGHTPGHMSVLLRRADGGDVLLVGDATYTVRSIHEELLPALTIGDELYLRSVREIKAFAEREPDTLLVPTHDPTAWHGISER